MTNSPSLRRLNLHYIAMQCGFWGMFAGICAYQAALLYARGFTGTQTGFIMAVRCLAGVLCQPVLGGFADRHPSVPLKGIVGVSLGVSFLAGLAFLLVPMGLGGTLAVFFIIGGLELSAYPLMDSMAVQYINAGYDVRYSLGRGLGSLAYAVCSLLLGLQVGKWGVESVLITHAALVAVETALVLTFPTFREALSAGQEERGKPQSALSLLRGNPRFTLMLCAMALGLTACIPLSNFLVNVITAKGGATQDLSLGLFLMAASELPTTFVFFRLHRRLGSAGMLALSMLFVVLKALGLLLAPSLLWVYLAQPLQMLGYGLFTPTSVYYVNETVPPADRVRGQTLMMVASNGLGGVLGSLLMGRVLDLGGTRGVNGMLLLCIALGIAATALALAAARPGRKASAPANES